jgi:hypothetical protein
MLGAGWRFSQGFSLSRWGIRRRVVALVMAKSCARKRWPGRHDKTKHSHVGLRESSAAELDAASC